MDRRTAFWGDRGDDVIQFISGQDGFVVSFGASSSGLSTERLGCVHIRCYIVAVPNLLSTAGTFVGFMTNERFALLPKWLNGSSHM